MRAVISALGSSARSKIMTLTSKQASASLPTGEATGAAPQEDWRAATMTAEARQPIGAWLNRDDEFNEAVVLLRAYLRQRGYQIGGR
jgi:hypothetical protein